jgi:LuxR family maltose regulon positive regulatory protein
MMPVSSVRLAVPRASAAEIERTELVSVLLNSQINNQKKFAYIHAGAGYGKTTLLSQAANSVGDAVWLTLDGESDVFSFMDLLSDAVRRTFPAYYFNVSEYLPFEGQKNFTTVLANAFLNSVEKLEVEMTIILEDIHTIREQGLRSLIACIVKYKPDSVRLYLSSREAPWQELIPMRVRGESCELTARDLAFTREEVARIIGFDDVYIYAVTEGWPLAIGSFKVLLENGVSPTDIASHTNEALYSYLFYECVSRLSPEMAGFLKNSASFEELDPQMLDFLLGIRNSRLLLESLVMRNLFTIKTDGGYYRYHTLFRNYLLESGENGQAEQMQRKAAGYYFAHKQYAKAAEYAVKTQNKEMLGQIILLLYEEYLKAGRFSELRTWFFSLGDVQSRELLVAKGAYFSSVGNFTEAQRCLDEAIPLLHEEDGTLYFEAMVHKARVLRNSVSFEASNGLLDEIIPKLGGDMASEQAYRVVIEKIYNLCWNSQITESLALAHHMIETCAKAGNVRVKAWYERYLSVVYYVAGRMKDSVYYYEKAMEIPEEERRSLDMHSIEVYVAKAYQMLGEREKAVTLVTEGIQKLRSAGRYEELWLGYLFAAEIHYQNTSIARFNGGSPSFETTVKYFTLADEYAPLYRKSAFQKHWANLQRNISALMFTEGDKEALIRNIFEDIPRAGDHFKTIALGRLFNYFGSIGDYDRAADCARRSIAIGEAGNTMMVATTAYGFLARIALAKGEEEEAARLIRRLLRLCQENGNYEYFRMRSAYEPILAFAVAHGIEPDFAKQMMSFAGCKMKKAYIETLGGFAMYPYQQRNTPLKMRTKKERELLAFLLDAGNKGVTKEQIYEALWFDSDSDDIKKLIGVNLAQIKKDLDVLGVEEPIVNEKGFYSIRRDEIVVDADLLEAAAKKTNGEINFEIAQEYFALYKGEYLSGFEAHWAASKRIRYAALYEKMKTYCMQNHMPSCLKDRDMAPLQKK